MFHIEGEKPKGPGGRPAIPNTYKEAILDGEECMIGTVISNGSPVEFIIDKDEYQKVKSRTWFVATGGLYIGTNVMIGSSKKTLYLHNAVMNRLTFPGKGATETVDHVNRNGLDNRKSNLRITTQSLQNVNQSKKSRTADLPEGFTDLPRHVWYIKAHGSHGDRFAVELKTEKLVKKTTSSKKVSIQDKFQEVLRIREELYTLYPYLRQED
jgi:hypothetical protein